jgi:hypothetical protein
MFGRDPPRANEIKEPIAGKYVLNLTPFVYTPEEAALVVHPAIEEYVRCEAEKSKYVLYEEALAEAARRFNGGSPYVDSLRVRDLGVVSAFLQDIASSVLRRGCAKKKKQTVMVGRSKVLVKDAPLFDRAQLDVALADILKPAIESCLRQRSAFH